MAAKCNLILDSCCDLPPAVVCREGVELIRLSILDEEGEHLDDLWQSMDMHEFYMRMSEGSSPSTSQASAMELRKVFERAANCDIPTVYLCFSSGLSSHFEAACTMLDSVLAEHPDADIRIVDTKLASTGEALLAYEALRKRDEGLGADEMVQWANDARYLVNVSFMVDDLSALQRGGRIPKAVALAGAKLGVKPLLTIDADGKLAMDGVARGRKKGLRALATKVEKNAESKSLGAVCIGHADCEEDARRLEELLREEGYEFQLVEQPIGSVIGSHVGPGMVAISFWGPDRRKK